MDGWLGIEGCDAFSPGRGLAMVVAVGGGGGQGWGWLWVRAGGGRSVTVGVIYGMGRLVGQYIDRRCRTETDVRDWHVELLFRYVLRFVSE